MHPRLLRIQDFTYHLPDDRIARYPAPQRDASKLLIYREGNIDNDTYANIAAHLPAGALMVFNATRVVHARLMMAKPTGGLIEIFCLEPHEQYADIQTGMLQKGHVLWKCMVGGAAKWKNSAPLTLTCDSVDCVVTAQLHEKREGEYIIHISWSAPQLTFAEVLHHAGKVPLPPYIDRLADVADTERYQTIFATQEGSVAAPTAGLHFTPYVLQQLASAGIATGTVTLHVGAGTFMPVKSDTMDGHDMHAEWIDVDVNFINQLLTHAGGTVVAVGTTSARTLESLYWIGNRLHNGLPLTLSDIAVTQWEPYETALTCTLPQALQAILNYMHQHGLSRLITRTRIIIAPGYTFRVISALVTNFHQPQSTLLLLVAALIGNDWRKVYEHALDTDYRFLSYGDGSLLWKSDTTI